MIIKCKFIWQTIQEKAEAVIAEHEHTHFNTDDDVCAIK